MEFMYGIICGLQIMGYMRKWDLLSKAINNLSPMLIEKYCPFIIDCIICQNVHLLKVSDDGIFIIRDNVNSVEDINVEIINNAFEIIQLLDELHAVGDTIKNNGWINGERDFRIDLQQKLQKLDKSNFKIVNKLKYSLEESQINGINRSNQRYALNSDKDENDSDVKWFDALSNFAFNQK